MRIIFMAMMNEKEVTDKPHKHDDLRIHQGQEVRDYAALRRGSGFSTAQDHKEPAVTTSGKPKIRTETGTDKVHGFF